MNEKNAVIKQYLDTKRLLEKKNEVMNKITDYFLFTKITEKDCDKILKIFSKKEYK